MINFPCPHCGINIDAEPEHAGCEASCPTCDEALVVPAAPVEGGVAPQEPEAPATVGSLPPVPGGHEATHKIGKKKMVKLGILVLVGAIVICATVLIKGSNPGAVFWKFQLGSPYEDCIKTMKQLKSEGIVTDLSVGSRYGGTPGNISVSGDAKSDFDGILTIPCSRLYLSFEKKQLVSIELSYSFRREYPSDLFEIQVKDMERLMGTKAVIEMKENDVGDRRQVATIKKKGIRATIVNKLDGSFSSFAPDILIRFPK